MLKSIRAVHPKALTTNAPGFTTVDMFHAEHGFEPFLVFTEFYMDRGIFGPHPHAGVSVMTYMLPDSQGAFLNRDSLGDRSIIAPGDIHVTQAGSGIHHDEVPTEYGVPCHGLQIWINHADSNRLVAPQAFHAVAEQIPTYSSDGIHLRVLQGTYQGMISPIELVTKTELYDIVLDPHTILELPAHVMAFVYCLEGGVQIQDRVISARALVTFENEGNTVRVQALDTSAHIIFASGIPHNEPIVYGGPFVMTTAEQMHAARKRLGKGEMGTLAPL